MITKAQLVRLTKLCALFIFSINSALSLPLNAEIHKPVKVTGNDNLLIHKTLVNKKDIVISNTTGLRLFKGEPYSGDVVVYYPSGKLAKRSSYKLGLRHGFLKQWFTNGVLSFSAEYIEGVLNGITQSWWNNGNTRSISPFLNGKVHGYTSQWYATGEKFKKMHYKQGKEVGLQQAWRRNGKLYSNYEYVNGRIFGLKRANMCVELESEQIAKKNQL